MVLLPEMSMDQIRKYGPTQNLYIPQDPMEKAPRYRERKKNLRSMMNLEDILVDSDMNIERREESIYYILKPQRLSLDITIFFETIMFYSL